MMGSTVIVTIAATVTLVAMTLTIILIKAIEMITNLQKCSNNVYVSRIYSLTCFATNSLLYCTISPIRKVGEIIAAST